MQVRWQRSTILPRAPRVPVTLAALLLAQLWMAGGAPRAARAQLTRVPQVALLDLYYAQEPTGGILSRQAGDALAVEMTRQGRYDVTPRAQLVQQVEALGLPVPLDAVAVRRLGQALGVDYVARGHVASVSFLESPRRARATLALVFIDVASGEAANGAFAVGVSTPSPAGASPADGADQEMVTHALRNAAFRAVEMVSNYQLPEATVLITRDGSEVRLNVGSRGGISPGQEMVIYRGGEWVGRVRVTGVTAHESVAVVTDSGRGIRPEDRARAVFSLGASR